MVKRILTLLGVLALGAIPSFANIAIAFSGIPVTTNWDPSDVNLGLVFTPNANISVTALGVYFQGGDVPNNGSESVGLYTGDLNNPTANLLASENFALPSIGSAGYLFESLDTPVSLTSGDVYTVVAYTNGNSWAYGSTTTPSSITFSYDDYNYTNVLAFPDNGNGSGPAYYGPNFEFSASATPEPGFYGLLGLGLGGVAAAVRRRKSAHKA